MVTLNERYCNACQKDPWPQPFSMNSGSEFDIDLNRSVVMPIRDIALESRCIPKILCVSEENI